MMVSQNVQIMFETRESANSREIRSAATVSFFFSSGHKVTVTYSPVNKTVQKPGSTAQINRWSAMEGGRPREVISKGVWV